MIETLVTSHLFTRSFIANCWSRRQPERIQVICVRHLLSEAKRVLLWIQGEYSLSVHS